MSRYSDLTLGISSVCGAVLSLLLISGAVLGDEKPNEIVSGFAGAFSQVIPIEVPPFRGLEPRLALGYSSGGRNGFVGVGWGLAGFSVVERMSPGMGSPAFDSNDIFVLDGQELIPCPAPNTSPSCTTGGSHTTKNESYLKIFRDTTANTWSVWGKDGTKTVLTSVYTVPSGTLSWGQTSRVDTHLNTVTYGWTCQGGDCYPSSVTFGPYSVMLYPELRPDVLTSAAPSATSMRQMQYRLRSIRVSYSGSPIRAYKLSYTTSPVTGASLLEAVQQYGKDVAIDGVGLISGGTGLPARTFAYQDDALAHGFRRWPSEGTAPPPGPTPSIFAADVALLEGHVGTTPATVTLSLSQASSSTVTVSFATQSGTAGDAGSGNGNDYTGAAGVVTFPPGSLEQTVTVNLIGDTTIEPDEYFTVQLASPVNATLAVNQARVTILNDDFGAAGTGTGVDGALTVGSGQTQYTDGTRTALSASASAGATTLSVTATAGFAAGQEVLIIQMVGGSPGQFETRTIQQVSGLSLILTTALGAAYSQDATNRTQVIRVFRYSTVTVQNGGTLTVHAWDGSTGGVMFFRASGAVNVQPGGVMTVAGKGFAGSAGGSVSGLLSNGGAGGTAGVGNALSNYCPIPSWCDACPPSGACQDVYGGAGGAAPSGSGAPVPGLSMGNPPCSAYRCYGGNGGGGGGQGSAGAAAQAGAPGTGIGGGGPGSGGTNSGSGAAVLMGGGGGGGNGGAQGIGAGGGGGGGGAVLRQSSSNNGSAGVAGGRGGQGGAGGTGGIGGGVMIVTASSITVLGTASAAGNPGAAGGAGAAGLAGGAGGAGGVGDNSGFGNTSGAQGEGGRGGAGGNGATGGGGGGGGTLVLRADTIVTTGGIVTASGGPGGAGGAFGLGGSPGAGTVNQGQGPIGVGGPNGTMGGTGRVVTTANLP
jgi:hypothetical protein